MFSLTSAERLTRHLKRSGFLALWSARPRQLSGQKPARRRQLNTKVCGSESAIFVVLLFMFNYMRATYWKRSALCRKGLACKTNVQQRYLANGLTTHCHFVTKLMLTVVWSSTITQRLHSFKYILFNKSFHNTLWLLSITKEAIFWFCIHMRTYSLVVPRPYTTIMGLGTRLAHERNRKLTTS